MQFLEKVIWALTALVIAAFVLVVFYWKRSDIPEVAIDVELIDVKSSGARKKYDFSTSRNSKSGRASPGGSPEAGRGASPGATQGGIKLQFPPKRKYTLEPRRVTRNFREKYANSYRDAWEAAHRAESEVIKRPDGTAAVRLLSIDKGSMIERLGFNVGDEITMIQGHPIDEFLVSKSEAWELGKKLHAELREETDFEMVLDRKGATMVLYFHVPK